MLEDFLQADQGLFLKTAMWPVPVLSMYERDMEMGGRMNG